MILSHHLVYHQVPLTFKPYGVHLALLASTSCLEHEWGAVVLSSDSTVYDLSLPLAYSPSHAQPDSTGATKIASYQF